MQVKRVAELNKVCIEDFVPRFGSQLGCVLALHVVKSAADCYRAEGLQDGLQALQLLLSEFVCCFFVRVCVCVRERDCVGGCGQIVVKSPAFFAADLCVSCIAFLNRSSVACMHSNICIRARTWHAVMSMSGSRSNVRYKETSKESPFTHTKCTTGYTHYAHIYIHTHKKTPHTNRARCHAHEWWQIQRSKQRNIKSPFTHTHCTTGYTHYAHIYIHTHIRTGQEVMSMSGGKSDSQSEEPSSPSKSRPTHTSQHANSITPIALSTSTQVSNMSTTTPTGLLNTKHTSTGQTTSILNTHISSSSHSSNSPLPPASPSRGPTPQHHGHASVIGTPIRQSSLLGTTLNNNNNNASSSHGNTSTLNTLQSSSPSRQILTSTSPHKDSNNKMTPQQTSRTNTREKSASPPQQGDANTSSSSSSSPSRANMSLKTNAGNSNSSPSTHPLFQFLNLSPRTAFPSKTDETGHSSTSGYLTDRKYASSDAASTMVNDRSTVIVANRTYTQTVMLPNLSSTGSFIHTPTSPVMMRSGEDPHGEAVLSPSPPRTVLFGNGRSEYQAMLFDAPSSPPHSVDRLFRSNGITTTTSLLSPNRASISMGMNTSITLGGSPTRIIDVRSGTSPQVSPRGATGSNNNNSSSILNNHGANTTTQTQAQGNYNSSTISSSSPRYVETRNFVSPNVSPRQGNSTTAAASTSTPPRDRSSSPPASARSDSRTQNPNVEMRTVLNDRGLNDNRTVLPEGRTVVLSENRAPVNDSRNFLFEGSPLSTPRAGRNVSLPPPSLLPTTASLTSTPSKQGIQSQLHQQLHQQIASSMPPIPAPAPQLRNPLPDNNAHINISNPLTKRTNSPSARMSLDGRLGASLEGRLGAPYTSPARNNANNNHAAGMVNPDVRMGASFNGTTNSFMLANSSPMALPGGNLQYASGVTTPQGTTTYHTSAVGAGMTVNNHYARAVDGRMSPRGTPMSGTPTHANPAPFLYQSAPASVGGVLMSPRPGANTYTYAPSPYQNNAGNGSPYANTNIATTYVPPVNLSQTSREIPALQHISPPTASSSIQRTTLDESRNASTSPSKVIYTDVFEDFAL